MVCATPTKNQAAHANNQKLHGASLNAAGHIAATAVTKNNPPYINASPGKLAGKRAPAIGWKAKQANRAQYLRRAAGSGIVSVS
jgi:hypothetical protein